ncbi:hydroxyethylthiazole kinase-like uncharacterized protein yjeF [Confluentimicrobium naphthalenivorans]|uniref:NAD(P)H-hydrate epimerase n=1 Tax=Actibacterium naphthalenivorans TaxID=1614693 RepID=A0A840C7U8_9RHOB|nr:hydroxyethylthiazole kinase-like uncharacterized protein yjeF [Actibacterium naphthalenivorans]
MAEPLTSAQMRAIEQAAIGAGAVTGLDLMERAGRGVVEAVFQQWPGLAQTPHRAVILCGPGNNGGDGFVVARMLKQRGWDIAVFLYGDAEKLPADAKTNCARWRALGPLHPLDAGAKPLSPAPDLVVDAIFGTGLTRPLEGALQKLAQSLPEGPATWHLVAVDIPTGLNADTGAVLGAAFPAELTVTFHSEKRGHRLGEGPRLCGRIVVKDIGLSSFQKISPPEA